MNFTLESLQDAENTVKGINDFVFRLKGGKDIAPNKKIQAALKKAKEDFIGAINDDLDMPNAFAALFTLMRTVNKEIDKDKSDKKTLKMVKSFMDEINSIIDVIEERDVSLTHEEKKLIALREQFRKQRDFKAAAPACLVALNKVDLLKPTYSWNPPYNLTNPAEHVVADDRLKAESIRECVACVGRELNVSAELIVPICASTPTAAYNLNELVAAIEGQLPAARTRLLRRLLREHSDDQYWESLRGSIKQSGKLILRSSLDGTLKGIRKFAGRLTRR